MRNRLSQSSRRAQRAAAGFTLVELLIAIVILLVGIVSVAKLVPTAIQSNFRNRNDSTALITAQRLLEQMARQPLNSQNPGACGAAIAGQYYFCDNDFNLIALGQTNGGTVNTQDGCTLAGSVINFTLAAADCPAGYRVVKQWVWNPDPDPTSVADVPIQKRVELRWNVITMHVGGVPVRKVFTVGARVTPRVGATPASGFRDIFIITNLQTVVSR